MSVNRVFDELSYKSMVDGYSKPVAVFDRSLNFLYGNQLFNTSFNATIKSLNCLLLSQNHLTPNQLDAHLQRKGQWITTVKSALTDSSFQRLTVQPMPGSQLSKFVAVFEPEPLQLLKGTDARSTVDELTQLPNRYSFDDALNRRIRESDGNPDFAVIYIDLDHFKDINELHGHEVGDQLLQLCAERIRLLLRREDVLARLSGDEFAAVVGCEQSHEMQYLCHRLMQHFERPVKLNGTAYQFTLSIGIAFFPEQGNSSQDLLINAEKAMFNAKKQGRAQFQLFDRQYSKKVEQEQRLAEALRLELKQTPHHFHAVYQPLYCVQTGKFRGVEVLARWQSPELGSVSPVEFIPLAEARGLINTISGRLFESIETEVLKSSIPSTSAPLLAVNVSAQQITDASFEYMLIEFSYRVKRAGWQLEVELTESQLMTNADGIIDKLESWREQGIRIAIDDFGTGYSCLAYLHTLPVDKLKIDRQFLQTETQSRKEDQILYAIMSMANALNMEVLVEGVETTNQLYRLRELGCGTGQGFGLARPQAWRAELFAPLALPA